MSDTTSKSSPAGRGGFILAALALLVIAGLAAIWLLRTPAPPEKAETAIRPALEGLARIAAGIEADETALSELRRLPADAARDADIRARTESLRIRREAAAQILQDLGAEMELPPAHPDASGLVRFSSHPVERHNYAQIYHPIEGPQPYKMADGFSFDFDQIIPQADGSLVHRLDARRGGAIKWERELQRGRTQGHYTVEATINATHPGVVYAPLWLFSEGSSEGGHEFDFELMQGRIEYNLHNGRGGLNMRRVEKDVAGHRMRFEIIRRPGKVTMRATSLTDGWSDELVITPERVAEWASRDDAPQDLQFPGDHVAMFPVTELWRCNAPGWCGQWTDLPDGNPIEMVIHGYRVDP